MALSPELPKASSLLPFSPLNATSQEKPSPTIGLKWTPSHSQFFFLEQLFLSEIIDLLTCPLPLLECKHRESKLLSLLPVTLFSAPRTGQLLQGYLLKGGRKKGKQKRM